MKLRKLLICICAFSFIFVICNKKVPDNLNIPSDLGEASEREFNNRLDDNKANISDEYVKHYLTFRKKFVNLLKIFYPVDKKIFNRIKMDIKRYDKLFLELEVSKNSFQYLLDDMSQKYETYRDLLGKPLELVSDYLDFFPPYERNYAKRKNILLYFDKIITLDKRITESECFKKFIDNRMKYISEEIRVIRPTNEIIVWSLYGGGFIIRDKKITVGFDLVKGADNLKIEQKYIDIITKKIDVLFFSQIPDDYEIGEKVKKNGGGVVIPQKAKEKDDKFEDRQILVLDSVYVKRKKKFVKYFTFSGLINIYRVNMTVGKKIMYLNSKTRVDNFEEFNIYNADILISNYQGDDLERLVKIVNPNVVILGNINGTEQSTDFKGSFKESYKILKSIDKDKMILNWAEKYIYFLSDKYM